jgi:hypothetical protein
MTLLYSNEEWYIFNVHGVFAEFTTRLIVKLVLHGERCTHLGVY